MILTYKGISKWCILSQTALLGEVWLIGADADHSGFLGGVIKGCEASEYQGLVQQLPLSLQINIIETDEVL